MTPIDQTDTSFVTGNCFQACMASMLEMPLDSIPNFMKNGPEGFQAELDIWCQQKDLVLLDVTINDGVVETLFKGAHLIACGKSPRATEDWHRHSVIWKDGELAHDPRPEPEEKRGLDGEPEFFTIMMHRDMAEYRRSL